MSLKIVLNRKSKIDLSQQLYLQLKQLILEGELAAGKRIPSSREIAETLHISRPTVAVSLEQLQQEGFLFLKHGSGTYVSQNVRKPITKTKVEMRVSKFGNVLQKQLKAEKKIASTGKAAKEPQIAFYCWRPALDRFPHETWARILGRNAREHNKSIQPEFTFLNGQENLRDAIVQLVRKYRGLYCTKEQVIIVNGLHQAIDLVARLQLNEGDTAIIEEPGYHRARDIFSAYGAKINAIAVDEEGIKVSQFRKSKNTRLIYVTPSHQFPTGHTMSLERRQALLNWAQSNGAMILEDDYDSEYHGYSKPIPALMSLDKQERVIYTGTFNQIMMPSLGIGYLIVPLSMVALYSRAHELAGDTLAPAIQDSVAEFITAGHLDSHIRKLRVLYTERRAVLIQALEKHFAGAAKISGQESGVFILAQIDTLISLDDIIEKAAGIGIGLTDTRNFYCGEAKPNELVIGFGGLKPAQIRQGIKKLAKIMNSN